MRRLVIGCVCFVLVGSLFGSGLGSPPQTAHAAGLSCPHLILDDSHNPYRVYINECWIKALTVGVGTIEFGGKVATLLSPELEALFSGTPGIVLGVVGLIAAGGTAALNYYDGLCSNRGIWVGIDPKIWNWHLIKPDLDLLCSPVPPVSNTKALTFYDNFVHHKSTANYNKWREYYMSRNASNYAACTFNYPATYTAIAYNKLKSGTYSSVGCGKNEPFANGGHGMVVDVQYYTRLFYKESYIKNADIEYSFGFSQKLAAIYYVTFSPLTGHYSIWLQAGIIYLYRLAEGISPELLSSVGQVKDIAVYIQNKQLILYSADNGSLSNNPSRSYLQPSTAEKWQRIVVVDAPYLNDTDSTSMILGNKAQGQYTYSNVAYTSVRVWQLT